LVFGKEVTLQTYGKDKYKRTIADVILPDGLNVNPGLVKEGWCWWYRKYAAGDTMLEGLGKKAREGRKGIREGRKGLWADPQPVPPWEWRKVNCFSFTTYFLALVHLGSSRVALSGTRIVGQNKSGSGCPPPNQASLDPPRSITSRRIGHFPPVGLDSAYRRLLKRRHSSPSPPEGKTG
jgi:hypothetical protein